MAVAVAAYFLFIHDSGGGERTTSYEVPSESMELSYSVGEVVTVNLDAYRDSAPELGDVVVFHPPSGADSGTECAAPHSPLEACPAPTEAPSRQNFMKRIVAGPGDTLSIKEGHPVVGGVEKADEPYALPCESAGACNLPKTITIPANEYFMLGDNRGASDDSRFWVPSQRLGSSAGSNDTETLQPDSCRGRTIPDRRRLWWRQWGDGHGHDGATSTGRNRSRRTVRAKPPRTGSEGS